MIKGAKQPIIPLMRARPFTRGGAALVLALSISAAGATSAGAISVVGIQVPLTEGVRVPEENLLGTEGNGWTQLMAGLNNERVILGAGALGLAQRAFDDALAYAKERRQFGRPIGTFQAIQHKFADMATDLAQARLLVRWVARLTDDDKDRMLPQEASMVKLACTELAKRCALEGMQIMGGYGYATEYPMERYLRAAVVTTIYGGTSEIQKNIIAKTLGL